MNRCFVLVAAGVAQMMLRRRCAAGLCTFGRPNCAHSDARGVHIRTPELCTFGRPNLCQQGCVLSRRSHCHGPQHWFCRVRCLRNKVPPEEYARRRCRPLPHKVNVVEPSKGHVRVQKRYFFSPWLGSSSTLTHSGEGGQNLAR